MRRRDDSEENGSHHGRHEDEDSGDRKRSRKDVTSDDEAAEKASALAAVISARLKAAKKAPSEEAEVAARRERARAYQEKRRGTGEHLTATDAAPAWNLEDENDMDEADELFVEAQRLSRHAQNNSSQGREVKSLDVAQLRLKRDKQRIDVVAENDPLNDFLESFEPDEEEVVGGHVVQQWGTNTITLEEIMASGGWESSEDESDKRKEKLLPEPDVDNQDDDGDDDDEEDVQVAAKKVVEARKAERRELGRLFNSDGDVMEESERRAAEKSALEVFAEHLRKKELRPVDHANATYLSIRKNLYVVPKVLGTLSAEQVEARRAEDEIKVRGVHAPPPVESWAQCGLPAKADEMIRQSFGDDSAPFPIQKQAIPVLMSGRDAIGIAKTGSGKTLAFALPALRHAADQPPIVDGSEGPIVLIMAPARELAMQIYKETKRFAPTMGSRLRCTCVYGGARVAEQIADLKRGAEVVVCTPGRMIDLLTMQQGRMLGLSRVSFVVLDEADRMFDMGFEPQIAMILRNVRPDRQTALFSATFPKTVEQLARKTLAHPVEIVVGGKSVAAEHVMQFVEVREEHTKFMRLLQLLGVWYEKGSSLIFVDTQAKCDSIYADLLKAGYASLALHGGHDQADRESTIADFKAGIATVLVATSVAGRGLDVPAIRCVVNYSTPNHLEDYVHRIGRTGRAGREGTAYTFLDPVNEEAYAPMLLKALKQAKQRNISEQLEELAAKFKSKVQAGDAKWAASGFTGNRGFKFDEDELTAEQKIEKMQKQQFEIDLGLRATEDDPELRADEGDDEDDEKSASEEQAPAAAPSEPSSLGGAPAYPFNALAQLNSKSNNNKANSVLPEAAQQTLAALSQDAAKTKNLTPVERAKILAATFGKNSNAFPASGPRNSANAAIEQARALAASLGKGSAAASTSNPNHFADELDINDYPAEARLRATHRENFLRISEETGAALIHRGVYCPPGRQLQPGEKRLYVAIEASSEMAVQAAKAELTRVLNEETRNTMLGLGRGGRAAGGFASQFGKYAVL